MNFLIVVAHPDDEVLGVGGTMYKLSKNGHKVDVCIMSGEVNARNSRPEIDELNENVNKSLNILGVNSITKGNFPNIEFNTIPHLNLVKFIEDVIFEKESDVIITHHPADLNNDHYHTSIACQAAIRLFQRNSEVKPIKEFLFMEVPSATDWSLNKSMNHFNPNTFIEIDEIGVEMKIHALSEYIGVMRPFPHPRSAEVLRGLAALRGGQSGFKYAESFECVFRREL